MNLLTPSTTLQYLTFAALALPGLPITIADDPLSAVVRGAGIALDQLEVLREITFHV